MFENGSIWFDFVRTLMEINESFLFSLFVNKKTLHPLTSFFHFFFANLIMASYSFIIYLWLEADINFNYKYK
jgi:hypothetical protein